MEAAAQRCSWKGCLCMLMCQLENPLVDTMTPGCLPLEGFLGMSNQLEIQNTRGEIIYLIWLWKVSEGAGLWCLASCDRDPAKKIGWIFSIEAELGLYNTSNTAAQSFLSRLTDTISLACVAVNCVIFNTFLYVPSWGLRQSLPKLLRGVKSSLKDHRRLLISRS